MVNALLGHVRKHLPALFFGWEKMFIANLLDFGPLVDGLWPETFSAFLAKIFDLSAMGVAIETKVIKENIYFEILVQNFAFVFADVFRTQLHFTGTDVVAVLNE